MDMDDLKSMARTRYGYGTWAAPFWFLGPEEGLAESENNDLAKRIEAWRFFGTRELDDCRDFHTRIDVTTWHGEDAILQSTWRKLLLTLMARLGRPTDCATRLSYQRNEWGRQHGETCVIELSGLAAHSLKVERDRECFRAERIVEIRERIRDHKPEFVVMYGKSRKYRKAWNEIANGAKAISEGDFTFADLRKSGPTTLALTPAPTSFGPTNENWIELGEKLRKLETAS
jgi:hypothetical protein